LSHRAILSPDPIARMDGGRYRLDRAALAPVADRIGPTHDEVHVPSAEPGPA
jgi:hypothetical protein